ncbi:MAG: DegV family protein [Clostridia bacterium]|nr:DegV family protein [Clostridia bacterium]
MNSYVIVTESSTDLTVAEAEELGVVMLDLSVVFEGKEPVENREVDIKSFYERLRQKETITTAAINMERFSQVFCNLLAEGKDVLYMGFSSALSGTYAAGRLAAEEAAAQYPGRTVLTVDTKCASLGQGLLVYLAAQKQKAGSTLEETYAYVNDAIPHLCHQFTVNDLFFLKRGGRVSTATAVIGTMLSIKPVMHVDDEGRLVKVGTVRGRRASVNALFDKTAKGAIAPAEQVMYICHGDCIEDAEYLAGRLQKELGVKEVRIGYTGAVIGAHSGPGTLAVFYLGTER